MPLPKQKALNAHIAGKFCLANVKGIIVGSLKDILKKIGFFWNLCWVGFGPIGGGRGAGGGYGIWNGHAQPNKEYIVFFFFCLNTQYQI